MFCSKCGQEVNGSGIKGSSNFLKNNPLLRINSILAIIASSLYLVAGVSFAEHANSFWAVNQGISWFYQIMAVLAVVSSLVFLVAGALALIYAKKLHKYILKLSIAMIIVVFGFFVFSLIHFSSGPIFMVVFGLPVAALYFIGALHNFIHHKEGESIVQSQEN